MQWFWGIQIGLDLLLIGWVMYYVAKRRTIIHQTTQDVIGEHQSFLETVEKRAHLAEKKLQESRSKLEAQLKNLLRICEKANEAIDRLKLPLSLGVETEEEKDLRTVMQQPSLAHSSIEQEELPTVETKLKAEKSNKSQDLDLRQVLEGQLS